MRDAAAALRVTSRTLIAEDTLAALESLAIERRDLALSSLAGRLFG